VALQSPALQEISFPLEGLPSHLSGLYSHKKPPPGDLLIELENVSHSLNFVCLLCTNQSGFTNIDLQCGQSKVRFLPIFFIDCCDSFSHTGQIDAEVISVIWSIIRLKKDIIFSLKNE